MKRSFLRVLAAFSASLIGAVAVADSAAALAAMTTLATDAEALVTGALPLVASVVVAVVGISMIPRVGRWIKSALGR